MARTYTYIAADWSQDKDAVDQLRKWNDSDHWGLSFKDAHDLKEARDDSLSCSIKRSLKDRLDESKAFVLIVGSHTKSLRSGSCQYCDRYDASRGACRSGYSVDLRSYIEYECDEAAKAGIKITVLYNAAVVDRSKCPEMLVSKGKHAKMKKIVDGAYEWDYHSVKDAMS